MRPPPPGRRGPRRRGVRAGVTRTPVTVAASCSRKVTRTACQEAQGWLLTSCQVERTTGPRSSRLAGTRHGLRGQHEAGAALSAQHEGGVWTPVPARRNRPLPAGERAGSGALRTAVRCAQKAGFRASQCGRAWGPTGPRDGESRPTAEDAASRFRVSRGSGEEPRGQ